MIKHEPTQHAQVQLRITYATGRVLHQVAAYYATPHVSRETCIRLYIWFISLARNHQRGNTRDPTGLEICGQRRSNVVLGQSRMTHHSTGWTGCGFWSEPFNLRDGSCKLRDSAVTSIPSSKCLQKGELPMLAENFVMSLRSGSHGSEKALQATQGHWQAKRHTTRCLPRMTN